MGQYFYPILINAGKKTNIRFCAHNYGNGVKLLEHSYFGNPMMYDIYMKMFNKPWRVAWIGDYADGMFDCDNGVQRWDCMLDGESPVNYIYRISCGFIKSAEDFHKYYIKSNGRYDAKKEKTYGLCKTEKTNTDIINEIYTANYNPDTHEWDVPHEEMVEFIHQSMIHSYLINKTRKEYINCARWYKECVGSDYDRDNREHYAFHPLPLLTACGNGLGSGDFHLGDNYNCQYVGFWAFNNLYFSNEPPKDFHDAEYLYEDFEAVPFN